MSIALALGTFRLDGGTTYSITSIEIQETKTVNTNKIPKTDGSIAELGRRDFITITLDITISAANNPSLRTALDNLRAAFQNGIQKFTLEDDRYIMAQMNSLDKKYINVQRHIELEAVFIAHWPFWLSVAENEDSRIPTSGVGYTIVNNGNAPARCKISVTALSSPIADNIEIQNTTNGKSVQYRGTLADYQVFIADNRYTTDDFIVTNNAVDDTANYEGDFIELAPGNNTIVFTGGLATVDIKWRDCWY